MKINLMKTLLRSREGWKRQPFARSSKSYSEQPDPKGHAQIN